MRRPREVRRGECAAYHCMSRTVAGQFLLGHEEKLVLRRRMRDLAEFCQIRVHTHTTLSNHFHVVLSVPAQVRLKDGQLLKRLRRFYGPQHCKTEEFAQAMKHPQSPLLEALRAGYLARMGDLAVFMKELKEGFSKWFNKVHERFGTLWAERYKSVILPVLPAVMVYLAAYVDLNAVRAGLVGDPGHYEHCGYAEARARPGPAREGLACLLPGRRWPEQERYYRKYLYLQGSQGKDSEQRVLDPAEAIERLERTGRLERVEMLHLKLRPFTEGIAVGFEAFVEGIFQEFRQKFCKKRTQGGWRLVGADWGGLMSLKKFKNPVQVPKKHSQ
jgi:putative transposase